MQVDADPASIEYVLSTFPLAHETFVTGEIRAMAGLVPSVAVTGMVRSGEADIRPGGIPQSVAVRWIPGLTSPRVWGGMLAGLMGRADRIDGGAAAGSLRAVLRWNARLAGARAHAAIARPPRPHTHHLHAHFAARGAAGAHVLSRAWRVPYSMTVHAYDIFLPNPRLRQLTLDASLVVAISDYDRRELLRLVPEAHPARVTVIHAGVPVEELGRASAAPTPGDRPLVVAVGRLVPKKGMDILVRAVAALAGAGLPVSCEIVGDGPDRARLEALISELGVASLVTLRGGLPPAQARRRVAEADLFALACVRAPNGDMDGIPVALMEAMAASTPAISTHLSGIPELIADGESGLLVEPGDVRQLAAAIRRLVEDRPLAERMAAAGRRRVAEAFDQATNARHLLTSIVRAREALGSAD